MNPTERRAPTIEPYVEAEAAKPASARSFGYTFSIILAIIGLWPLFDGAPPRYWAIALAALFSAAAAFVPSILRPLRSLWLKVGELLHRVVTPVIMGLVFIAAVVPTGMLMRAFGKDPLRLKLDKQAKSYWIERDPSGPHPRSMTRQF
jgi:hypothetical protein